MTQRRNSAVEHAISSIRDSIRLGKYAPGQRLVVAELSKKLSVSAGPVREAIRRLTGEGVIDITPNRGAAVRDFNAQELADIFRVREVVEGLAARLAAENVDKNDYRARLIATLEEMRRIVSNKEDGYVQLNQSFHELIYEMAENRRLFELASQLTFPIYRLRMHYHMSRSHIAPSAQEHEAVAAAILAGNGWLAEDRMRQHVRTSGAAMVAAINSDR